MMNNDYVYIFKEKLTSIIKMMNKCILLYFKNLQKNFVQHLTNNHVICHFSVTDSIQKKFQTVKIQIFLFTEMTKFEKMRKLQK